MPKIVSLKTRLIQTSLISSIVAGGIALLLFFLISVYQTMQMQDEIMDEVSDMLLIADLTSNAGQQVDELSEQFDIQYQLLHHQQVLTQSEDFHATINKDQIFLDLDHHYGFIWENHQLWRSYVIEDEKTGIQTLVLQPFTERFKDLLHSIAVYSFLLLSLWVLQWLMLRILIKRQFRVVEQLSKEISEKHADDLHPIQSKASELKEFQPIILQLNHLLARLDQSQAAEQRFTSDASHELRSPLSAIQMRLQLLQRKHPELHTDLNTIQTDVKRGTQVLENLILLARLDPEHADRLPKTHFKLDDLLEELIHSFTPFFDEKQIQISLNLHPKTATFDLFANRELLFICIRNLLDNAIRYSPMHSTIEIDIEVKQNQIALQINNPGDILTTETMQRLGERFYRVLGTQTQGSGLGLSICKKIVDLHHGHLQFLARPTGGMNVSCTFPI